MRHVILSLMSVFIGITGWSQTYNVTFQVDMNNVTDAFTTPEVNGTFNSWCGACAPMTDTNLDGIWEVTIPLAVGTYEYKYAADNWAIQETLTQGASCTVNAAPFVNRALTVSGDVTLDPVCWASCSACATSTGNVNLTFDDAASITPWQAVADATLPEASISWDPTGVSTGALSISGTNTSSGIGRAYIFQYVDNAVDYNGASTVELSFDIKASTALTGAAVHLQTEFPGVGTTNTFDIQNSGINTSTWTHLTYTFTGVGAGNLFRIQFNIAAGAFVGAGGGLLVDNIQVVGQADVAGCMDSGAANYNASATTDDGSCVYNVTFQVNMNDVVDAFTTPEVNGAFNGWCGGCAPMADANTDGIWDITIPLAPGSYEFKYAADSWAIQEALTPGSICTVTASGFTNRVLNVGTSAIVLDPVCWASCYDCGISAPVHNVTFQVNMNNVTDAFTTPEVNGSFNGWCGNCNVMTDANSDGIWEVTLPLTEGNYQYKFSADAWTIQESLTPGDPCTFTDGGFTNRNLSVTSDITLDPVCWNSCSACAPSTYNVTFQVDMNNVTDAFTTPEVNGTFNSWCGNCAAMSDANSDGIWDITIALAPGVYEYKFAADNWAIQETLPEGASCTVNAAPFVNRSLNVSADVTLDAVCWGSCSACPGGPSSGLVNLTFDDAASLTPWQAVADATLPEASLSWNPTGVTTGALSLSGSNGSSAIGRAYICQYIDNAIDYTGASGVELSFDIKLSSPLVGAAVHMQTEFPGIGTTNTFDIQNSGLNESTWTHLTYTFNGIGAGSIFRIQYNLSAGAFVGAGGGLLIDNIQVTPIASVPGCMDAAAANYNASATTDDGSCLYNVTFQVNMNTVLDPFTTPEVNGGFNGWCGGCAPMSDANLDGVWDITIALPVGSYEFKYAADSWAIQENLTPGSVCTVTASGFTNRILNVTGPVVLDPVCWASCYDCGISAPTYNVTFQVDMNNVTDPFTTPEVNGSFNGWCGNCNAMTDANSDGIWEITLPLSEGNYQYKFSADAWNIQENLTAGDPCTFTDGGFTNRNVVITGDITLDPVCWNSCNACDPTPKNVTFQVDMNNVTDPFTTPEVNGIFNGWCGGCAPMTDANSDGIWELTIQLLPGDYEYKFAADSWNIQENLAPGSSCTVTNSGFTNRFLSVTNDIVLDPVCWASCASCAASQTYNVTFQVDMNNVTDPFTTPEVNGIFNGWCGGCAAMTDANSDGIWEITIPLQSGSYEYKFAADSWNIQETLTEGSSCTVNAAPFVNRFINVTGDVVLDPVCWGSCLACSAPTYNVTFQVNMNGVTDAYTTPEINGVFNGWCGGCAPMSDANNDGIWEITIPLQAGNYEYKFAADSWNIQENLTPGDPCTVTNSGFTNRLLSVTGDATLDAVCWGTCDVGSMTLYVDADGDGYGAGAGRLFCSMPASGYSATSNDCNDGNALINPGASEVCGNNADDDCDGSVNEGCSVVANDDAANATSVNAANYPFCSNRTANLTGATASPEAQTTAPVGAGQDVWYQFVAESQAARIRCISSSCDVVIELHSTPGTMLFMENETTTGQEILNANNLTTGNTYYVLVRNFNPSSVGSVVTCIQALATSGPNNGTTFNTLCSYIKCAWNGAQLYSVTFDDGVNQYTASSSATQIPFASLPGLQYGQTYQVTFTTTFIQNDAGGNPTTSVVESSPYSITIANHTPVALRSSDRCPTTRSIGSFVGADTYVCGSVGYQWEFTLADEFGNPISLDPVIVDVNSASRYVRTSSITGVQPGDHYNVRVRPVFSSGPGTFGSTQMLCIAGSAGIATEGDNATPSLNGTDAERSVKLYPNPSNGEMMNIQLTGITSETVQVNVIDALGRVIVSNQYSVNNTFNGTILFDTKLSSGMYNVQIIDGENTMVERVMVN